jgi:peroxiredoxin
MGLTLARLALGVLLALAVTAVAGPAAASGPQVGDRAPDFTLPSTAGKPISLSDFRGKQIVLLEFYGADFNPV